MTGTNMKGVSAITKAASVTMKSVKLGAVAFAAAVSVDLVGCTATTIVSETPTVERLATPETPAVEPPTTATTDAGMGFDANPVCEGTPGIVPVSNDNEDQVYGYGVPVVKDQGPSEHARGEAILGGDNVPVAYPVVEGDTAYAIAQRFCIGYVPYLGWINSVRRNGVDELYAGDTINLDRNMITTVGDENGVVFDNDPSFHIPPQR